MLTGKNAVLKHHDQSPSVQQRFVAHTNALVIAFKRQVTLLTRIATKSSLSTPERLCQIMLPAVSWVHMEKERSSMPISWRFACSLQQSHSTFSIKMNKIHLPSNRHKNRNKQDSTKEDMHLLRQLYMTMHVRERNSDRLFEVENADCPPSLSKHGALRSGQKSDLLSCLEVDYLSDFDEADAKLIDGAHMVHFRPDASIKSFRDYVNHNVIPYIERHLANTKRVDVDRYLPDSLKATTRQRRGAGIAESQESDSGCDMMGMGHFREIGAAIYRPQVTRWNCSIICQ